MVPDTGGQRQHGYLVEGKQLKNYVPSFEHQNANITFAYTSISSQTFNKLLS
jgi:hypothetical protein